ncbi:HEXXH motif domain-containing protein [Winogradskya consettensis]|uniref:HEXXH motif domain-containing protein n=1 Tax=Winogradskya consettensis TaxID=113560 RepID=UPI001BB38259|nr:HEXXH motif domain-containing protein [Actinoplanes consettensis]
MSAASFAALSRGDGSPRITQDFWKTEESRRLLLASTLMTEIGKDPALLGPLPPITEVIRVLTEAQEQAPAEVGALLIDPEVGSGCAYALRRLRGGARGDGPLWLDLGIVHALALAASARAGLPWSTRLPLRDGNAMIPSYGIARFAAGPEQVTEAHTTDGDIRLRSGGQHVDMDDPDGGASWWSLRSIRAGEELPLTVRLDDLDPLRDLADPVPPARLDDAAFERWRRLITSAWELLCRDYRADAEAMAGGVVSIVPLQHEPGWDTRSASHGEAFGAVMMSEPRDAVEMAVTLIHEFQHIRLGALLHLIRLTEPDDGTLYYAPWRDDPRPLPGLIQGVYAFFGIAKFWRIRWGTTSGTERTQAAFEYALARQQTAEALRIVLSAPGLTESGQRFFQGLHTRLGEWSHEPADAVDPDVARLAAITADSHRIGWRLRHFRPRENDVAELISLRTAGKPAEPLGPVPAAIRPHAGLRWDQHIPAAARRRILSTTASPDPLIAGEAALLSHDVPGARAAFVSAIGRTSGAVDNADVPDDEARAWAGLALSLAAAGDTPAATALRRRPDLVRAVYAGMGRRVDPADIATWLGPAFPDRP